MIHENNCVDESNCEIHIMSMGSFIRVLWSSSCFINTSSSFAIHIAETPIYSALSCWTNSRGCYDAATMWHFYGDRYLDASASTVKPADISMEKELGKLDRV